MPKGITKNPKKKYDLTVSMNGEVFDFSTDDLKKSLQKFEPEQVHTEVYINIKRGLADFTKKLTLVAARKLFRDEIAIDMFVTNFISLYE